MTLHLGTDSSSEKAFHLEADHLRTHAVIVGMTGSGKTGLGLVLLEELARSNVPVIAIDPKGDLANLALLFPDLGANDFAPWLEDKSEAQDTAARWKKGLAKEGIGPEDIKALHEKIDLKVYTPGSRAGTPVDLLGAFKRPTEAQLDDEESVAQLVQSTVSGLLGLAGRKTDPVRDPAHIVLSKIVYDAWMNGEDPTIETLILRLMDPPFEKVGVFALNTFFPPKERSDVGLALNAVVASPSFSSWKTGVTLDIEKFLERGDKNPVSIFSIAHLDETQRQFFLSILLGKVLAHSRQMPGTNNLRGLVYFDEVAGYLPPHPHQPPTKTPLLTMMKQSRAVGLGVVLSTQNPVDLDYKALSNAGVWALGRLQTQQDRDRVLKGMGRTDLNDAVESLRKREFVFFDAKEEKPTLFKTRHAMCYLRGPFTRHELGQLKKSGLVTHAEAPKKPRAPITEETVRRDTHTTSGKAGLLSTPQSLGEEMWFLDQRVVFSKAVSEIFRPFEKPARDDGAVLYEPALYADISLRFDEDRVGFVEERRERKLWFPLIGNAPGASLSLPLPESALLDEPEENARFTNLPSFIDEKSELKKLKKEVLDDIYRHERAGMFVHKKLKLTAKSEESKEDFAARVKDAAQDDVDEDLAKLHERMQKKVDRVEAKVQSTRSKIADAEGALRSKQLEEVTSIGETLFGMFSGRKNSRKVSSAVRKRSQSAKAKRKVETLHESLERYEEELADLALETEEKMGELQEKVVEAVDDIEEKEVRLEKADIELERFGVLWIPVSARL